MRMMKRYYVFPWIASWQVRDRKHNDEVRATLATRRAARAMARELNAETAAPAAKEVQHVVG
jgi:hypothetical protein